jgi:hypothetical protein
MGMKLWWDDFLNFAAYVCPLLHKRAGVKARSMPAFGVTLTRVAMLPRLLHSRNNV